MLYRYFFSFRKKTLLIHIVLLVLCLAVFFPFVERAVSFITIHSLEKRAGELIAKIEKAPDLDRMIEYLRAEKAFVFFRITLFNRDGLPAYDTHFSMAAKIDQQQLMNEDRSEVMGALKYGQGHGSRYSPIFRQSLIYFARPFDSHGQEYVLRIGLPFTEIRTLAHDFEIGFLTLGMIVLVLYGIMIWFVIYRMTSPIQDIISAIRPYQEGKADFIPRIEIKGKIQSKSEFGKLAKTFNDMNDRIQKQIANLVEQQERTKEILESLGEGVVAVDVNGSITFANASAGKMLGLSVEILSFEKFSEIRAHRQEMAVKCRQLIEKAIERSEMMIETFTVNESPNLYFDLIAAPLAQHSGVILVLQDKTSDYEVIEMGKDFIANASHELRTPITIIRGFAETLHDLPQLSQAQTKEITEKILKTCIRLNALVKSLLILADIENLHEDQFQSVDLIAIAENCKQLLLVAQPTVKISIERKTDQALILADGDLLAMAIMNLLENAVKYSPVPAQIEMLIEPSNDQVLLSIKDRGIGIPETDLHRIFDRFYTVDKARSRKFGGTGLGLSIVKTIIQKHRGEVTVISHLGEGSTFTARLPAVID
ncbi:MAG: phoR [Parachlamydiales bacterium]|nr:phoR [Parachlamydiales bacterium]